MNALKTTSVIVATLCSVWITAASADDATAPTPALTRAEVLADLEVWQLAGMPALTRTDAGPDENSVEFKSAHAKYQQMKASPDFAQRVIRIARKRGERVDVASN